MLLLLLKTAWTIGKRDRRLPDLVAPHTHAVQGLRRLSFQDELHVLQMSVHSNVNTCSTTELVSSPMHVLFCCGMPTQQVLMF